MENEKTDRLRGLLQEAFKPIIERLDRIEEEIKELKEQKQQN